MIMADKVLVEKLATSNSSPPQKCGCLLRGFWHNLSMKREVAPLLCVWCYTHWNTILPSVAFSAYNNESDFFIIWSPLTTDSIGTHFYSINLALCLAHLNSKPATYVCKFAHNTWDVLLCIEILTRTKFCGRNRVRVAEEVISECIDWKGTTGYWINCYIKDLWIFLFRFCHFFGE